MKKFLLLILLCVATVTATAQTASILSSVSSAQKEYELGIQAYNAKKYVDAYPHLKAAAAANIPEAFRPLIKLLADGDYDGSEIGNYTEALAWAITAQDVYIKSGSNNNDLCVALLLNYGPLCFLTGDYNETIHHEETRVKLGLSMPVAFHLNQIAAAYLRFGNVTKANEYLDEATTLASKKGDKYSMHTANALRSKIAYDEKNYAKALELSSLAASEGEIPLAAFVYGAALIKTNNHPEIGQRWVKSAAEYNYAGITEINCFEHEIEQFWMAIKDHTY